MADAERCLRCGIIIPEGRQVCPACEVPERMDNNLICKADCWLHYFETRKEVKKNE